MHDLPLIAACPPRLSDMPEALRALEESGVFTNGGPLVRRLEARLIEALFDGQGDCLAAPNATMGLMLAIREAREGRRGTLAMMPSFTFAATAHAAIWAGLTPLLVDSDPGDWAACARAEEAALARYGQEIAVVVPYDTFAAGIDVARYERLAADHDLGVVIDAAASLGMRGADGRGFATGARCTTVFSMHATKPFSVGEGAILYSAERERVDRLRRMSNYGFGPARSAEMPGMNCKMPELMGLVALAKLDEIDSVARRRAALLRAYRARLGEDFAFQRSYASVPIAQFMPLLLPHGLAPRRAAIMAALAEEGIGSGHYFSPHLAQQPYFQRSCIAGPTPVADDIGARMLSLPITDRMTEADVEIVSDALQAACHAAARASARPARQTVHTTLLVGGGPAGVAMLISASKQQRLAALAQGLVLVERDTRLGGGQLADYAITSDSTAETFLSAVKDSADPELAKLVDHPGGREIARHIGALGVPLSRTGAFLEAMGDRIGAIVRDNGGRVLTGHEVLESRRTAAGLWASRVRDVASGAESEILSRNIVIATGGYQSASEVAAAQVAGMALGARLGERLLPSDLVLRHGGVERLRAGLADRPAPRIAIVGASTSALAAAALLLKSGIPFGAGSLALLHREPLRPFYPSAEAARADGFTDFGPDDICPLSGFVYRLAGFRLEARELVLRMLEIGGRVPDPRVMLHRLQEGEDMVAAQILDRADAVIGALGYRPHALPLFDEAGHRFALSAHAPGRPRLIDQQCRVIDAAGDPLPGAYGIGLAAGFVPEGALGGEPSFKGKANGLWQWQNDVGQLIVGQLLGKPAARKAA